MNDMRELLLELWSMNGSVAQNLPEACEHSYKGAVRMTQCNNLTCTRRHTCEMCASMAEELEKDFQLHAPVDVTRIVHAHPLYHNWWAGLAYMHRVQLPRSKNPCLAEALEKVYSNDEVQIITGDAVPLDCDVA